MRMGGDEEWGKLGGQGTFRTTQWTLILQAARPDSSLGQEAFGKLYSDYWPPLYAYVRRRGFSPEEAEDITQSFFTRILERKALTDLQQNGGRFRSFLLTALANFLANEWDRQHAQKRGSGQRPVPLEIREGENRFIALQVPDGMTPETIFEKQWVFTLLEQVMARLSEEWAMAGKAELFAELRIFLQGDRLGPRYAEIAARRAVSEALIKVTVHRLRQRYGHLLREEIARTLSHPNDVDEELHHLMNVLGR